ncbi:MAG: glycine cleavage system protein GcvH [Betaproteobacteria bacterium]|nr:glycine cleavage system protein GcvH [Betaproteobacteria bacterium]
MNIPANLRYTDTHEWIRKEDDGTISVGITDIAQDRLGDVVFVGDAKVGATLAAGEAGAVVESVKAASDIYAPVAGEVVAFNETLDAEPQRLNEQPYDAWIIRLRPANVADVDALLDAAAYEAIAGEA